MSVWHQFTLWLLDYSASFKGEADDLHTLSLIHRPSEQAHLSLFMFRRERKRERLQKPIEEIWQLFGFHYSSMKRSQAIINCPNHNETSWLKLYHHSPNLLCLEITNQCTRVGRILERGESSLDHWVHLKNLCANKTLFKVTEVY